jgi:hypothetical protein
MAGRAGIRGIGGLAAQAEQTRRAGRHGDTILAHISPEEYKMLARHAGGVTVNPETGMPEFFLKSIKKFFKKNKALKTVTQAAGAALGGYFGGPAGAALGGGLTSKFTGDDWGDAAMAGALSGIGAYALPKMAGGAGEWGENFGEWFTGGNLLSGGGGSDTVMGGGGNAFTKGIGGVFDSAKTFAKANPLLTTLAATTALGAAAGSPKMPKQRGIGQFADPGKQFSADTEPLDRKRVTSERDPYRYGEFGESEFFDEINPEVVFLAEGGKVRSLVQAAESMRPRPDGESASEAATAPRVWQSAPDHPPTILSYITPQEAKLLRRLDLHGSGIRDEMHWGPNGIPSFNGGDGDATSGPDGTGSGGSPSGNDSGPDMGIDWGSFESGFGQGGPGQSVTSPGNSVSGGPNSGASIGLTDAFGNVHGFTGSPAVNDVSVAQAVAEAMAANPTGFAATTPQATMPSFMQFNPISAVLTALSNQVPGVTAVNLGMAAFGMPTVGQAVVDAVGMGTNADVGMGGSAGNTGDIASALGYGDQPAVTNYAAPSSSSGGDEIDVAFARDPVSFTGDALSYGYGGEHKYYKAAGGSIRGIGGGQDDRIPAMLSDGEHVVDAETVSMLGDGSNDAGHQRLEQFKRNLRSQKRAASSKKIPPKAKGIGAYMREAA